MKLTNQSSGKNVEVTHVNFFAHPLCEEKGCKIGLAGASGGAEAQGNVCNKTVHMRDSNCRKNFFQGSKALLLIPFCVALAGMVGLLAGDSVYAQVEALLLKGTVGVPFLDTIWAWIAGGGITGFLLAVARGNYLVFKRVVDLASAVIGLIILFPLFLILALVIKIDSAGPVFFGQIRVGEKGKLFRIWKFRTMRDNAERETGPVWAQESDPRITHIGNFLRKSHLDELPQLFNILKGEMSLIGPRPERPEMFGVITQHLPDFPKRLAIKPGVTGLAQSRYQYGASIKDSACKLKYDIIYTARMNWALDVRILFWTLGRVITGEGAR